MDVRARSRWPPFHYRSVLHAFCSLIPLGDCYITQHFPLNFPPEFFSRFLRWYYWAFVILLSRVCNRFSSSICTRMCRYTFDEWQPAIRERRYKSPLRGAYTRRDSFLLLSMQNLTTWLRRLYKVLEAQVHIFNGKFSVNQDLLWDLTPIKGFGKYYGLHFNGKCQ